LRHQPSTVSSCPRRKPSSPTPLATRAAERAKAQPSPFPSTRALPHPPAFRHRSSKSRCMRGEPRRSFTFRRARSITHDPDTPVRAQHVLQPRPPPPAARPRAAHAPCNADLLSAVPLTLTCLTLLADTLPFAFASSRPARRSSTLPSRTSSAYRQVQVKCPRRPLSISPRYTLARALLPHRSPAIRWSG